MVPTVKVQLGTPARALPAAAWPVTRPHTQWSDCTEHATHRCEKATLPRDAQKDPLVAVRPGRDGYGRGVGGSRTPARGSEPALRLWCWRSATTGELAGTKAKAREERARQRGGARGGSRKGKRRTRRVPRRGLALRERAAPDGCAAGRSVGGAALRVRAAVRRHAAPAAVARGAPPTSETRRGGDHTESEHARAGCGRGVALLRTTRGRGGGLRGGLSVPVQVVCERQVLPK